MRPKIQVSKDYYAYLRPLFDNPNYPREDVIGSIYHFNDLHCDLKKSPDFKLSFIPVRNEAGNYLFSERIDERQLENLMNDPTIGPVVVNSQYLLNPVNPKDAKFKSEWLKEYEELPKDLAEYIFVDPASTQKKKSDYTVIEHWGIDWQGIHYLIAGIRDKLTVFGRIDKVVELAKRAKNLKAVKYEVLGGRHGDLEALKKRFVDERMYIEPSETKGSVSAKKDRIEQRLVGQFHAGVILFPKTCIYKSEYDGKVRDFVQEYKLEFLQFPFSEHDDILDCHSQMFEEPSSLLKGRKPDDIKKKEWGTADDWDKLYSQIDQYKHTSPYTEDTGVVERWRKGQIKKVLGR